MTWWQFPVWCLSKAPAFTSQAARYTLPTLPWLFLENTPCKINKSKYTYCESCAIYFRTPCNLTFLLIFKTLSWSWYMDYIDKGTRWWSPFQVSSLQIRTQLHIFVDMIWSFNQWQVKDPNWLGSRKHQPVYIPSRETRTIGVFVARQRSWLSQWTPLEAEEISRGDLIWMSTPKLRRFQVGV